MIKIQEIFSVPATKSSETLKAVYFVQLIKNMGLKAIVDIHGNIMVTKGKTKTYPTFCSHLDTVHSYKNGFNLIESEGILSAQDNNGQQIGVGGDRCVVTLLSN